MDLNSYLIEIIDINIRASSLYSDFRDSIGFFNVAR